MSLKTQTIAFIKENDIGFPRYIYFQDASTVNYGVDCRTIEDAVNFIEASSKVFAHRLKGKIYEEIAKKLGLKDFYRENGLFYHNIKEIFYFSFEDDHLQLRVIRKKQNIEEEAKRIELTKHRG